MSKAYNDACPKCQRLRETRSTHARQWRADNRERSRKTARDNYWKRKARAETAAAISKYYEPACEQRR